MQPGLPSFWYFFPGERVATFWTDGRHVHGETTRWPWTSRGVKVVRGRGGSTMTLELSGMPPKLFTLAQKENLFASHFHSCFLPDSQSHLQFLPRPLLLPS